MAEKKPKLTTDQDICVTLDVLLDICKNGRDVMNSKGEVVNVTATHQDFSALMKWQERRKGARKDAGLEDDGDNIDPIVAGIRGMKGKKQEADDGNAED